MEQYELNNGWKVFFDHGKYYLKVTPIENSIFQKEKVVELPNEIALEIKRGEMNIKNLFEKFGLHKLIISWIPNVEKGKELKNTEDKYFGGGWFVERLGTKYYIDYSAAAQGGGNVRREITKEIYLQARSGKYKLPELIRKYNLY